jgi:hypothetical protein
MGLRLLGFGRRGRLLRESGLRDGGRFLRQDLRCLEGVSVVLFEVINLCPHHHAAEAPKETFSGLRNQRAICIGFVWTLGSQSITFEGKIPLLIPHNH